MKSSLLFLVTIVTMLLFPTINFGQVTLGAAASRFAIYTSSGAVSDNAVAHSHITGDVGTSTVGPITGFGNVNGVMHPGADVATAACNTALLATIAQIALRPATIFPPSGSLGSGQTLDSGVYSIPGNATLTLELILDAQGNPNAEFIIKIGGTFSTNTLSKVTLVNGALACHVYWKITGAVTMASLSTMRGNIISGGAITMGSGDTLEGRAFSTVGLISLDKVTAFTPVGCGSPTLSGPPAPNLASIACYTIFSSAGALLNTIGTSSVIGDVGNNGGGSITGWAPGAVTGTLHLSADPSTILAAADLSKLYDSLNAMVPDIELLYPADFGHDLVLTPHVYMMNSAGANGPAALTDSLYLDAQGNPDGVFVIKIMGDALTTSTYAMVKLINGAQSKNVFWMVQGAVSINNYSKFRGTIVVSSGALNLVNTGVLLDGRALTMTGAITTQGLTAIMPPGCGVSIITTQPVNQVVCAGSSASFSVVASGVGNTYQWRKGTVNLTNSGNISGATSSTLTINPAGIADTATNYNVKINGVVTDSSVMVSLTVNTAPNITLQPVSQAVCDTLGNLIFVVKATGTGITYQWRKGLVNLKDTLNISGTTSDTLRINPMHASDTASNYNVVVSGICLPNAISDSVSLQIHKIALITAEPLNKIACAGSAVILSVTATGASITYQWRKGTVNLSNAGNISGVNSDTLRIDPAGVADTAFNYNVIITSLCNTKDTSVNASLVINTLPVIISEPVSKIVCAGNSVNISAGATGSGLTYQWRKGSINLINTLTITGTNSDTLKINPVSILDSSSNYNVIVSGTCSPEDTSVYVSLTVNTLPLMSNAPTSKVVCSGNPVNFSVSVSGSGITYQWRKGLVNILNSPNISGANADTLKINSATLSDTSTNYHVVISGICAPVITTNPVSLTVNTPPTITTQPAAQTTCSGNTIRFSVSAAGSGLSYQWRKGLTNVSNSANISGANADTLKILAATISDTSTAYNVIVSGICSPAAISNNVSLTVNSLPLMVTQPVNQITCSGSSALFSVIASGTGLTYQWLKGSTILTNSGNISGAGSSSLSINPVSISDTGTNYHVIITGICIPAIVSSNVSLTVNTLPLITTEPNSQITCEGNEVKFIVAAIGTGITYQWRKGTVILSNTGNLSGVATDTLIINPAMIADSSSNYNVMITGTCAPKDSSQYVSLVINTLPLIITQPSNQTTCAGSSSTLAVTATGTALTYQWRRGTTDLVDGANISGAKTATLTINPTDINDAGNDYHVVISGTCAPVINSANTSVTVNVLPVAVAIANSPVCSGNPVNLSTLAIAGATYAWSGPNGFSSPLQNPTIVSSVVADGGIYSLTVSTNGCFSVASPVTVIVNNCLANLSIIKTVSNGHPLVGHEVTFTIIATNNGPFDATEVEITEVLQSGYTYISSTTTAGTFNNTTGIWNLGNMANGVSETLTIRATVNASGNYVNTVLIYGHEIDIDMLNNVFSIEPVPTDFHIPEGFSPNNDGINDLFVIRGIDNYPSNSFTIFNRWGDKVFGTNNYQNTWDGKATTGLRIGGDELPVGTYFYVLDLGDDTPIFKGTIYLNK